MEKAEERVEGEGAEGVKIVEDADERVEDSDSQDSMATPDDEMFVHFLGLRILTDSGIDSIMSHSFPSEPLGYSDENHSPASEQGSSGREE